MQERIWAIRGTEHLAIHGSIPSIPLLCEIFNRVDISMISSGVVGTASKEWTTGLPRYSSNVSLGINIFFARSVPMLEK